MSTVHSSKHPALVIGHGFGARRSSLTEEVRQFAQPEAAITFPDRHLQ